MFLILLLSKNILAEKNLQDQLQHLDYEVLCTRVSPSVLNENISFLKHFKCVILSETFSQNECKEIINIFLKHNFFPILLRKGEKYISEDEEASNMNIDYLSINTSLEELREKIDKQIDEQGYIKSTVENKSEDSNFYQRVQLTMKERKLLDILLQSQQKGEILSRKKLCNELWDGKVNASTFAQLSTLVQRIKRKCIKAGINGESILTNWGKGYVLDIDFLDFILRSKSSSLLKSKI